jgi:hypothetical protein
VVRDMRIKRTPKVSKLIQTSVVGEVLRTTGLPLKSGLQRKVEDSVNASSSSLRRLQNYKNGAVSNQWMLEGTEVVIG